LVNNERKKNGEKEIMVTERLKNRRKKLKQLGKGRKKSDDLISLFTC